MKTNAQLKKLGIIHPKHHFYTVTRIVKEVYQVYGGSREDILSKIENPHSVTVIKETIKRL